MTEAMTETRTTTRSRPIGVIVLAALAGIALLLSIGHLLQALGILPYFIGRIEIRNFNIWYVLLWGLMVWVWAWAIQAIWNIDPAAWVFLMVVSGFNLLFDFFAMIGASTTYTDLTASFIVNGLIFAYTLLPGTKRAFAVE
ncbi:MAG TPA: hypothetical protein VGJ46_10915 [Candidatus Limnocylindrales bacterium]